VIGIIRYSGKCKVCDHEEREQIEVALLARVGAGAISEEWPMLLYRDVKQHERQCLQRGDAA
jgi:hypothetical protein